jgi:hypothetical protein
MRLQVSSLSVSATQGQRGRGLSMFTDGENAGVSYFGGEHGGEVHRFVGRKPAGFQDGQVTAQPVYLLNTEKFRCGEIYPSYTRGN